MKTNGSVTLPEKFLTTFAREILTLLKKAESVCCMFTCGGGKRTVYKYFLSQVDVIKQVFGNLYNKTIFVYVDPDEVLNVSSEAYLRLILDNLIPKMTDKKIKVISDSLIKNPLILIKKNLENLVAEDWHIVIVLNDFEFTFSLPPSIYLNLESIISIDKSKISYLVLSTINLVDESILRKLSNLRYVISQNIRYFPLLAEKDTDYLINYFGKKINFNVSKELSQILYKICGGYLQLLKYSLNVLHNNGQQNLKERKKLESYLLNNDQIKIVCLNIWNNFNEKERDAITAIVTTGNFVASQKEEVNYFLKLGLVKKSADKKYCVFGTLFEEFVKSKLPKHKLIYNASTKKLHYGGQSCEDKFSYQEFKLLVYFINHENELVTRDQVAEAIWGKLYHDKYSDWSIDKTISILRKKLDHLGFPSKHLVTLKKRGFSFSNP